MVEVLPFVFVGLVGGAAPEIGFYANSLRSGAKTLPHKQYPVTFWIVHTLIALSGAGLVWIHIESGALLTYLLALNVGLTGPLFFHAAANRVRAPVRPEVD